MIKPEGMKEKVVRMVEMSIWEVRAAALFGPWGSTGDTRGFVEDRMSKASKPPKMTHGRVRMK